MIYDILKYTVFITFGVVYLLTADMMIGWSFIPPAYREDAPFHAFVYANGWLFLALGILLNCLVAATLIAVGTVIATVKHRDPL